jgi:hypothetical protein
VACVRDAKWVQGVIPWARGGPDGRGQRPQRAPAVYGAGGERASGGREIEMMAIL